MNKPHNITLPSGRSTRSARPAHLLAAAAARALTAAAFALACLVSSSPGARAQVALFDGIDWVMDRGAGNFANVTGKINVPPAPGAGPAGVANRLGKNNFNARVNDAAGNPDGSSPLNNDPWHAVRRIVFPRTTDITTTGNLTISSTLPNEIVDNPNANDPNKDSDLSGNTVRVQPRSLLVAGNVSIDMAHAFLIGGWTQPPNVAPGAVGDYRSPAGGFSFSTDFSKVYTFDYGFATAIHNDFLVTRPGGGQSAATQGELAALPYVTPEVYAAVENVLKTTATPTAVWELGGFRDPNNNNNATNTRPSRFTIDIYSPGDGTVIGNFAHPNVTRAIVRVSYGHAPTVADPNNVQTVGANGQQILAGVTDPRYSRLYLVDLGQSGWINIAPGGRTPAAFDYNGDPRYQPVVTLYTLTPDDVTDQTLFLTAPLITADAVRFNPQPIIGASAGLAQTADGNPVTAANPAIYSVSPSGRILGAVVGTNKFTNPPFQSPPAGAFDIDANDTQPLVYVAREEGVPNTTPIIPFDPTKQVTAANPLVTDPTLNVTAPVFYCIDSRNSNATKLVNAVTTQTVSVDRIRWRYAGIPDAFSGSGTSTVTPLLANVRCRDGILRPILYFVTTNPIGAVGHVYALDPIGNRRITGPPLVNQNTTSAYWVYPSYRPLTAAESLAGLLPGPVHDPNYNASRPYATGIAALDTLEVRSGNGALTAQPPWGADQLNAPERNYVDGDIIPNPAAAGNFIVRADTQVPFTGIQAAPMVIDDPVNPTGAQIIIIGGMNGRVYTFDAGGRGDFIYDKTHQNDALNAVTGIPFSIPGTTQRYWTWPHFSGDAFHAAFGSGAPGGGGAGRTNTIFDEPDKIAFPSSPAFQVIHAGGTNPFYIGSADGHMFALLANRDVFNGIDNQNNPKYGDRRSWVYPNLPGSAQDTQSLGAALSTPALFTPTGGTSPFLYFTCAGRVYCINADPPLGTAPTFFANTSAQWVFPFTNNPPFPDPNNSLSAPLDPGFNGTAPMLLSMAEINSALPNPNPVATDICYVVGGDSTVYGIPALSVGSPLNIATGQTFSGGSTRCSPTASRITGILGLTTDTVNEVPTVVFADDDGAIWGVSARPDPGPPLGIINGTPLLPVVWGHFDANNSRLASASLVNGLIWEGSEDGQLRAYGVGNGTNGLGDTLDAGEPPETGFGISAAGISIDLRGLNLFRAVDYAQMTKVPQLKTPARNRTGGTYTNTADPIVGAIDPLTGIADKTTWPALVDWGDSLYIAAYGVYHAQPQNYKTGTHPAAGAAGVPTIQVFLTISQPGQPSINATLNAAPTFISSPNGATGGFTWPVDRAIVTPGEANQAIIYGTDDPSGNRNAMSNPSGDRLQHQNNDQRSFGVYPYAVYYKLPILPDGAKAFTPGSNGYRVTARAVITQSVALDTNATPQEFSESSNFLQLGQHDYVGLVPQQGDNTTASAANPVLPSNPNQVAPTAGNPAGMGRRRDVIISNPLAVTVRSYQGAPGTAGDSTAGNQPNIIGMGPSAATIQNQLQVASNGNRVTNPYATANTLTSPIKSVFAPIGMIPHGSSAIYRAVNAGGNKVSPFWVADRSNLGDTASGGPSRVLRVRMLTKPMGWHGADSSVMNPLPWDLMPNDAQDTRDYPSLPPSGLDLRTAASGQDAVNGVISLTQPQYPTTDPDARVIVPTEITMTASVRKFQPANVNRGVETWKRADGTPFTFGSVFVDIGGNLNGSVGKPPILGPLSTATGTAVGIQSGIAYPAGGYVGEVIVEAVTPGTATGPARFNPQAIFSDARGDGEASITQAYRALEVGLTVPPSVKMRVEEQTLDLGKHPHGTGISDLLLGNNPPDFRVPFSPSVTLDWPALSPWDDPNQLGQFFLPFTLVNESNLNLSDVRIGKMMADAPLTAPSLIPLALTSDQTNATLPAVPYLGPANRQARGPGAVSSFDHVSKASQNLGTTFPERDLWPIPNPYVTLAGIQAAAPSGLQTTNALPFGVRGWILDGVQVQPTVHKPRVGDASGTIATIPDTPYDATAIDGLTLQHPKIGLAIPLGAPVGIYSAPVYPFEDNVPIQWQEWLIASNGFNPDGQGGFLDSHDGAINAVRDLTTGARTPVENHADPTFILRETVREARITGGVTQGTLAQVETFQQGLLSANPYDVNNNPLRDLLNPPFGFNMLPAALFQPTGGNNYQIGLYWSTPRQPNGSPFITLNGPRAGLPVADAPVALGYTALLEGLGGWTFGNQGTGKFANGAWWTVGGTNTFGLFPGYGGGGQPVRLAELFPSDPTEAALLNIPYVPGVRIPRTVKYASPSAAVRTFAGPPHDYSKVAQTAYLFWQGVIEKQQGNGAASSTTQFTESRTVYAPVPPGSNAAPDPTKIQSMLNDPALSKQSPKPLILATGAGDFIYLFWHAGNGSQTQLYYNFTQGSAGGFPATSWSRDTRLETPDALSWQSDPSPIYHQSWDTVNNKAIDVIDVVYTGVLKNRRTVETMLSRYVIDPTNFTLSITPLPEVVGEQMSRSGNTFSYAARDAAWAYGSGPHGELLPTDKESRIKLYISRNYGPIVPLVPANKGFTTDANGDHFPVGRYDPASGLIYYDSTLGGQIVIDPRSGTVTFPQVAPGRNDAIYVNYTPMVMRLNTSRDETNIVRTAGYGNFTANDPAFAQRSATTSPGSNQNPVAIMERDINMASTDERRSLTSPQVVFGIPANVNSGTGMPRLWVLYRKSDVSGSVKSTLFYKAMRLMARLPRPVALTNNNGQYSITNLTVSGNQGPYEVDWVRGRVYFTELDEGRLVTINYSFVGGQSGNLVYRVAWGDEISSTSQVVDPNSPFVDYTTPEVVLPTDSAVNEGQVTAFQIPATLRTGPSGPGGSGIPFQYPQGSELWVFWTSTRAGTTDLFYETVRPNLYPNAANQH